MARKKKGTAVVLDRSAEEVALLAEQREFAAQALEAIASSTIESDTDAADMVAFMKVCKEKRLEIQASLDLATGPLKEQLEALKVEREPVIRLFEAAEKAGKKVLDAALDAQRDAHREAMKALQTTSVPSEAVIVAATGQMNFSLPKGSHTRTTWSAAIEDWCALLDALVIGYLANRLGENPSETYATALIVLANRLKCEEPIAFPNTLLTVDGSALQTMAKQERNALSLPGVQVVESAHSVNR